MGEQQKVKDLTNQKLGKLTVIERNGSNKYGRALWLCNCDCGTKNITILGKYLLNGDTQSCGCIKKEDGNRKGKSKTRLYGIWRHILKRCYNENHVHYDKYGGKGVVVCDEWRDEPNGFFNFEKWAIDNGYQHHVKIYGEKDTTIDRIDVDGNYEPLNCRWADSETQANNKNTNRYVTINGVTKTLSQWSRESGIKFTTLHRRVSHNWDENDLLKPVRGHKRQK